MRISNKDGKKNASCFQRVFSIATMSFLFLHFGTIILLFTISLCNAEILSVTTKFTEKKSVATSYTTLQKISKIKCVEKCNKDRQNGRCTLAGYNKATKTCYLSDDDPQAALDTDDEMTGVFFYEPNLAGIINVFSMNLLLI